VREIPTGDFAPQALTHLAPACSCSNVARCG
jgi:hypothetical protein